MKRIIYLIMCICALNANAQYLEVFNNNIGEVHKRYEASEIDSVMPFGKYRDPNVEQFAKEREILIEFYNATGGDNWINNTNWCTDAPLSEWYGVKCASEDGFVWGLYLGWNNLSGQLPGSVFNLPDLQTVMFNDNKLEGPIPPEIGNLKKLWSITFLRNQLSGPIPPEIANIEKNHIGNMGEDDDWMYNIDLGSNRLSGTVPEVVGTMKHLGTFDFDQNCLSGDLPQSVQDIFSFRCLWPWNLIQNPADIDNPDVRGFNKESLHIKVPYFSTLDCTGERLTDKSLADNKYTILLGFRNEEFCFPYIEKLKEIYYDYKKKGLGIISYCGTIQQQGLPVFKAVHQIPWKIFYSDNGGAPIDGICGENKRDDNVAFIMPFYHPWADIADSEGTIVFDGYHNDEPLYGKEDEHIAKIRAFLQEYLGDPDPMEPEEVIVPGVYESSDYTRDGNVVALQKATEGNGINIVLMGDLYSDRLIADGTYEQTMRKAMETLFAEEPYKSFRHLFNVYMVEAVSKHEIYGGNSAFEVKHSGDYIKLYGNNDKCKEYAAKAVGEEILDETMVVVIMNEESYAGTCHIFISSNPQGDFGSGLSISYFTLGDDEETFYGQLNHEACGHGFAKLADEYGDMGDIYPEAIESYKWGQNELGWYKNIDFTPDWNEVRWSDFLKDERYVADGLGVFEGAGTYAYGAYRPTENSMMRHNSDGFNAPSREAIYYRIHKLAYGKDWQYDRDEFKAWDQKNLKANGPARAPRFHLTPELERRLNELHRPPVIYLDGKPIGGEKAKAESTTLPTRARW